jgi:hypothetical protein
MSSTVREDQFTLCTLIIIFRPVLITIRNFVEKIKTQILCSVTFFFSKIVLFVR